MNNSLAASYSANYSFCADYEKPSFSEETVTKHWAHTPCFFHPQGVAMTEFVARATFEIKEVNHCAQDAYFGFYLCSPEGKFDKAIAVVFDKNHKLFLKDGAKELASAQFEQTTSKTELMIVKKGDGLTINVNGGADPILEYSGITKNGGTVSLCANKASVVFHKPMLCELKRKEQPENTEIYRGWMRRA